MMFKESHFSLLDKVHLQDNAPRIGVPKLITSLLVHQEPGSAPLSTRNLESLPG